MMTRSRAARPSALGHLAGVLPVWRENSKFDDVELSTDEDASVLCKVVRYVIVVRYLFSVFFFC